MLSLAGTAFLAMAPKTDSQSHGSCNVRKDVLEQLDTLIDELAQAGRALRRETSEEMHSRIELRISVIEAQIKHLKGIVKR